MPVGRARWGRNSLSRPVLWASVALSLVGLIAPSSSAVPLFFSALPSGGAPVSWAYGGTYEIGASGPTSNGSASFQNFAETAVVITQANRTAGSAFVEIQRVFASTSHFSACWGSCAQPRATMAALAHGWEYEVSFLNLTDSGTVATGSGGSQAVALVNESTRITANFTESYRWTQSSGGPAGTEWFNLSDNVSGLLNTAWANPFGIVPLNFSSGMSWSSSALARLDGATTHRVVLGYQGPLVAPSSSVDAVRSVPPNPVSMNLSGTAARPISLPSGATAQQVTLFVSAPDGLALEGLVLAPADAFQRASFSSECGHGQAACAGSESTPVLDIASGGSGALGFLGSSTVVGAFSHFFSANSTSDTPEGQTFPVGVPPLGRPATPTAAATSARPTILATPESVGAAVSVIDTFVPHPSPYRISPVWIPPPRIAGPSHGSRSPGVPVLGTVFGTPGGAALDVPTALTLIVLAAGLAVLGFAAARRGPSPLPPAKDDRPGRAKVAGSSGSARVAPEGAEPEDPIGYLW